MATFSFEEFETGHYGVHCENDFESSAFIARLQGRGLKWQDGSIITKEDSRFNIYGSQSVYSCVSRTEGVFIVPVSEYIQFEPYSTLRFSESTSNKSEIKSIETEQKKKINKFRVMISILIIVISLLGLSNPTMDDYVSWRITDDFKTEETSGILASLAKLVFKEISVRNNMGVFSIYISTGPNWTDDYLGILKSFIRIKHTPTFSNTSYLDQQIEKSNDDLPDNKNFNRDKSSVYNETLQIHQKLMESKDEYFKFYNEVPIAPVNEYDPSVDDYNPLYLLYLKQWVLNIVWGGGADTSAYDNIDMLMNTSSNIIPKLNEMLNITSEDELQASPLILTLANKDTPEIRKLLSNHLDLPSCEYALMHLIANNINENYACLFREDFLSESLNEEASKIKLEPGTIIKIINESFVEKESGPVLITEIEVVDTGLHGYFFSYTVSGYPYNYFH